MELSPPTSSPALQQQQQHHHHHDDDDDDVGESNCWWQYADFDHFDQRNNNNNHPTTNEGFNAVSHLIALVLSMVGTCCLVKQSQGDSWKMVSFLIYGSTLCFLFLSSTLHHVVAGNNIITIFDPRWERNLRLMDHLAIFPLIAGTKTPLCLVFFPYTIVGWGFLIVVWGLSIGSMYVVAKNVERLPKWLTMTIYLLLGWTGVIMTFWLWGVLGAVGILLLLLGFVVYTVGGYIYTTEYPNPYPGRFGFHELWHVCVVLGSAIHFFMMYYYVLDFERD